MEEHVNNPRQFAEQLARHFALYPTAKLNAVTTDAWWQELKNYPPEVVQSCFAKARQHSPEFPATAPQIKALAEIEAIRVAKTKAESAAKYLLPAPELPRDNGARLHAHQETCDRALRSIGDDLENPRCEVDLRGVVIALCRYYKRHNSDANLEFATAVVSDWKRRKLNPASCIKGLRKAPEYCLRPPTIGILTALATGEQMGGYPDGWVDPEGKAALTEPADPKAWVEPKGEANRLAKYWEQENAHWAAHPDTKPADAGKKRWGQLRPLIERLFT